jgi:ABC-type transport system involved in multi-copper enzyme maturation permease subunit
MTEAQEKRPTGLLVAALLVALEGLFVGVLAALLGIALVSGEAKSLVTSVALFALVAAASAWVIFVAINLFKGKRWARSGGVFWQLVQLAVATGSFSGQFGSQAIGWTLIIPSVLVLALLFSKKVVAATMGTIDLED